MPTGIVLRDPREQLFAAAERVLMREGVTGLTSRSVTAEAGVSKGVLHGHFDDFDDFLAELVMVRIGRVDRVNAELLGQAGKSSVTANLVTALTDLFDPAALAVVSLVTSRDALRQRLRARSSPGLPLLSEATQAISAYLDAEQRLHRIDPAADTKRVALTLIGTGHLLFAGELGALPEAGAVHEIVESILVSIERP